MLSEGPRERSAFDENTRELYSGDPLAQVQHMLTMWARQAPPSGTYARMLAICANEVEKARNKTPNAGIQAGPAA